MARDPEPDEARHPIGVVAERTGLSPDLLRVWERRYRPVEPSRAPDGQRLYSDADVERLRLLRLATLSGRGIKQVARMSTEDLTRLVREDEAARLRVGRREGKSLSSAADDVERAVELARAVNAPGLESLLRQTAATRGLPVFLDALAAPLLRRLGEEWEAGRLTLAQQHLATAILERVLEGVIHFLVVPRDAPSVLLVTLTGEHHRMGTVLAATAAAAEGWRATYIGPDLPASEIASAAVATSARVVGVSVVSLAERERVLEELRTLRLLLPASVPLLAGGAGAIALAAELRGSAIHVVKDLAEFRTALWNSNGRGKT